MHILTALLGLPGLRVLPARPDLWAPPVLPALLGLRAQPDPPALPGRSPQPPRWTT